MATTLQSTSLASGSDAALVAASGAARLPLHEIAARLQSRLGTRLVAIAAGVSNTRTVHDWIAEKSKPRDEQRLRVLYEVTELLSSEVDDRVILAWVIHTDANGQSPIKILRDRAVATARSELLSYANEFLGSSA